MIVVLMGVTGSGKTTVGKALAEALGWKYLDADEFHSATNVAKMRAGVPLNDADRKPWLASLASAIDNHLRAGNSAVLACSALKQTYRDVLSISDEVRWVYLNGDRETIAERLLERRDHYMNPELLDSQFETLEEPKDALEIDVTMSVDDVVRRIRSGLGI
ncbi:MAG TPA: gluconokinase [Pyrinomonadaceae bacterium]|nr:gluconokinase [Pyrinomonadaceae bacterium]